jgi:predicted GNAT superfamily acetyltransferase
VSSDRSKARIRNVVDADLAAVYAINEAAVPHVNSISPDRFQKFTHDAAYFRVALLDTELAGYLVAFAPGAPYDSVNFRWFKERYADFLYIDRIAVAMDARCRGIASHLYRDFFDFARALTARVTCEVNTRPVNAESMAFHESFGFQQVGVQDTEGGAKSVSLMAVELNLSG